MTSGVIQIAKHVKGVIVFDRKSFENLLSKANLGDSRVAVLSLCGESGQGKSFLAKIFLKYLAYTQHRDGEKANVWLDCVGGDSVKTDEPGIYLYRDIFKVHNVAVLVMQVQGSFSKYREATSHLFALACMMSSMQIINVRERLMKSDVMFIQEFLKIASKVGADAGLTGMWGQELQVIVRDWTYSKQLDFGFSGGKQYFDQVLQTENFSGELKYLKTSVSQMFKNVRYFLVPHPGLATGGKEVTQYGDLEIKFAKYVQELATSLLSSANLQVKKFKGEELTRKSFLTKVEHFVSETKSYAKHKAKGNASRPIPAQRANIRRNYLNPNPILKHGPVKIIDITPDEIVLNADDFERILSQEKIGSKPIAIISIAGACRKGKSFILNLFLRYLRQKGYLQEGDAWMGDKSKPIADGFEWSDGIEAHTSGIMMYSEPFIVKTPKEEVAVLFVDTQGLFDEYTSTGQNMKLFAFNTLISSVQILNFSENLNEKDLEFLQFFAAYAKRVSDGERGSVLQSLKFLIRDWRSPRVHSFGSEGGQAYLTSYMNPEGKPVESKATRKFIANAFQKIGCFLMPHPGLKLVQDLKFNEATLNDIDEKFVEQLTPLMSSVLHPDTLVVKVFRGKPMSAQGLYATATKCIQALDKRDFKVEVDQVMEIILDAKMNEIRREILEGYTEQMTTAECKNVKELQEKHRRAKKFVLERQYSVGPNDNPKKLKDCEKHAEREIDSCFERFAAKQDHTKATSAFVASNKLRDALAEYRVKMSRLLREVPLPPDEFEKQHEEYWQTAEAGIKEVALARLDMGDEITALEEEIPKLYEVYRKQNEDKFEQCLHRLDMARSSLIPPDEDTSFDGEEEKETGEQPPTTLPISVRERINQFQKSTEGHTPTIPDKRDIEAYNAVRRRSEAKPENFKHYIKLLEKELSKNKTSPKIEPDEGRVQNIRLRRFVNECVQIFDTDTKKFSGVYVGQGTLDQLLEKYRKSAIETFNQKTDKEMQTEAVHRHRMDLAKRLEANIDLLHKENARNLSHFKRAQEQMFTGVIKRYHKTMDQLLKSGYIVKHKLTNAHAQIRDDILSDMKADDLPLYNDDGADRSDHKEFKVLKKTVTDKLNELYEAKKNWNKKNHGIIVRGFTNLMQRKSD